MSRRFHTIGIEDLNVRGMMANRRLSQSIADMSFFEFRRQPEYKAELARRAGGGSRPLVSKQQDLLGLRLGARKNASVRAAVDFPGL